MLHPQARSGSPRRGLSVALTLWIALGAILGFVGLGTAGASNAPNSSAVTESSVEAAVASALTLKSMPTKVSPSLDSFASGTVPFGQSLATGCRDAQSRLVISHCQFGDTSSNRVFMLVGDSQAQMWFDAIDGIAKANHYKFYFLTKEGCPTAIGNFRVSNGFGGVQTSAWPACSAFNAFVLKTIKAIKPMFVILSSESSLLPYGETSLASPATETADFLAYFKQIPSSVKLAVLGGFPAPGAASPSLCLSRIPADIQTCTFSPTASQNQRIAALQAAANESGATFIDQGKWLCAQGKCPPVISHFIPYWDGYHMDVPYTKYLIGVLWSALSPVR